MAKKKKWYVDLPDPRNLEGEWVTVGTFDTRKEARAFCKKHKFNHTRPGVIDLITGVEK